MVPAGGILSGQLNFDKKISLPPAELSGNVAVVGSKSTLFPYKKPVR